MTGSRAVQLQGSTLEIIAFHLGDQQFCIKTTSIREIRGWAAATPLPHSPPDVIGVMNLRGSVIPIIDLAAEVGRSVVGLVVDQVSDILSIRGDQIRPVPDLGNAFNPGFSQGIIPLERGMVCFLDLDHMFVNLDETAKVA